jgi:hypothetical protein
MDDTCAICIEPFTKQPHRKQAACPYCDVKACVKCTQTYLLNTQDDPHCMGCRKAWSREVLDSLLLSTWLNGDYKKHRENVLLDRERSRLPAAQLIVERQKRAMEREPIRQQLFQEIQNCTLRLQELQRQYEREVWSMNRIRNGTETSTETNSTIERRAFVMPCPATGCRGFLSTAYKCGICDIYVCPDCREIKGLEKDAEHRCDPNTVETIRAMKKDTRPCPECGTNIFKIDGCDMMFCTHCNTPFSWTTGKKVTNGVIHNPHYFEYLRAANGGVMPRAPGDIPCGAALPNAWTFDRQILREYVFGHGSSAYWLYQALRTITHIQHVEIHAVTNQAEDTDNTENNVRYLQGEITQERWKQLLQQREKRRMKRDEIRQRYEAFVGACVDIYGRIMQLAGRAINLPTLKSSEKAQRKEQIVTALEEAKTSVLAMRQIFNQGMMEISKRYKCSVLTLTDKALELHRTKYTPSVSKKETASVVSETASV